MDFVTKAWLAGMYVTGVFASLLALFPEHTLLVFVSGVAGGLARALSSPQAGAWQRINMILTGSIVAVFLWPVGGAVLTNAFGRFDLDEITAVMTGGFTAGLLGTWLIQAILSFVEKEDKANER